MKRSFGSLAEMLSFPMIITILLAVRFAPGEKQHTRFTFQESPLQGRWDITVQGEGRTYPSWLEISHSGNHTLVGRFVSEAGSARPISEVKVKGTEFSFSIPPQWEQGNNNLEVTGKLAGDQLKGNLITPGGKTLSWTAVRAPSLRRTDPPKWGEPIHVLKENSLDGWHALGKNQWLVKSGVLTSPHSGANLVTDQKFNDFKLHIEFRYPKGSNSGVYLRGRYEVQVLDSKGHEPGVGELGAVYGFLPPSEMVAGDPGQWQSFDITLIGRMVTMVVNGVQIICNREIPGITGGALDSNEGEPGPLLLQGDHGPIEYRNIILTPAR